MERLSIAVVSVCARIVTRLHLIIQRPSPATRATLSQEPVQQPVRSQDSGVPLYLRATEVMKTIPFV